VFLCFYDFCTIAASWRNKVYKIMHVTSQKQTLANFLSEVNAEYWKV